MKIFWVSKFYHENERKREILETLKNFDFDNYTGENIFSHPFNTYMENERLKREKQFSSKTYLSEMPCSHTKMRLKKCTKGAKLRHSIYFFIFLFIYLLIYYL